MSPSLSRARRLDRCNRQRGAAMMELALVLTVLTMLILGTIDFGRISHHAMALTNAARAGALHGAQPGNSTDVTGMQNAALNSAASDIGTITATASRSCECQVGTAAPTVMTSCPPPGVPVCTGTVRMRVSVTASKTFSTLTTIPWVRQSLNVSRTTILRAQ